MFHDPLNTVFLVENANTSLLGSRWVFEKEIPSTNDLARKLVSDGAPDGTLVIADAQTRGKGRLGRDWASPPQSGLYFSAILYPPDPVNIAPLLALLAGVSVAKALSSWCPAHLKWPNDILIGSRKVCGILCEFIPDAQPAPAAIIGIGVNIHQESTDFPPELRSTATSLFLEANQHFSRTTVTQSLVEALDMEYQDFLQTGPQPLINQWSEKSRMFGREVTLKQGTRKTKGTVKRLNQDGNLVLETDSGEESFAAGEVTIEK